MGFVFVVLGAIVTVIGTVMVASGIPVREFSFGNTLIIAGTVAAVGGLIVLAVGAAIVQIRKVTETLSARETTAGRDLSEMLAGGGNRPIVPPSRPAFPPNPGSPSKSKSPLDRGFEPPHEVPGDADGISRSPFAPMVREEPPVPTELDEPVSLAPPAPPPRMPNSMPPSPPPFMPPAAPPSRDGGWRPPMPKAAEPKFPESKPAADRGFDAMWSGSRAPKPPTPPGPPPAPPAMPRADLPPRAESVPRSEPPAEPAPRPAAATPILKSGVVDGMGYTLYVDGSIEADLPQGTVRFASIADLRAHLEKNS